MNSHPQKGLESARTRKRYELALLKLTAARLAVAQFRRHGQRNPSSPAVIRGGRSGRVRVIRCSITCVCGTTYQILVGGRSGSQALCPACHHLGISVVINRPADELRAALWAHPGFNSGVGHD